MMYRIKNRLSEFYYLLSRRIILFPALMVCLTLMLFSCEKTVTVDIPYTDEKIVVEGYIETGQFPKLVLSKTLPFFGTINAASFFENTIQGAMVTINDGQVTDTMQQVPGLGVYFNANMIGQAGRTYSLRVEVSGKILTATTYIPLVIPLDSVWWKVDGQRDSLGFAWGHLTDPDTLGNCYRWFAQRINHYTYGPDIGKIKDSIPIAPIGSAFDDKFINGKSFNFSAARGHSLSSTRADDTNEEDFLFKRGDTIVVKFCTLDRAHFEFWRTEESQISSSGNPFGSPQPVTSNITGGLGIWGGYGVSYDTIIAR